MTRITQRKSVALLAAVLTFLGSTSLFAQSSPQSTEGGPAPKPLLQDIKVYHGDNSSDPLVKKTSSVTPVVANRANSPYPVLSDVDIPGYSGILVQTLDGKTVVENYSAAAFNPASNVKLATAYAVLKTFGPDYRFLTNVYTDGTVDRSTGTLTGNVYVSGRDPIFGYEHAVRLASELNRLGITNVTGNLIVTDTFSLNYNGSALRSGQMLAATMDASKRSAGATKIWLNFLSNSGKFSQMAGIPTVTFGGPVFMQPIPSNLRLLFTHESAPLREIIKATLCYSNNFMAERLGDMVGGPDAVARIVQLNAGVQPSEFSLQTSSGLGINRVTPSSMMKLLRSLRAELARNKMTFADIMPVAGIDKGTLESRFDSDFSKGSVVGKTGTLGQTDGGVSSLAGEISTRNGKLLFVVFNMHGSVSRFRAFQNNYISLIQGQFGGPAQMTYNPVSLDVRLARSRVTFPEVQTASN